MRISVVTQDGFVSINGEGYRGVDLSQFDSIQLLGARPVALQWFGDFGEVEFGDAFGKMVANFRITDLTPFMWLLQAHATRKAQVIHEQQQAIETDGQLIAAPTVEFVTTPT